MERAEGDVFEDGGHEELIVGVLKDIADFAADIGEGVVGEGDAADAEVAFAADEAGEVEQKRCFAGAVGAEDGDGFPGGELEVDAAEGWGAVGIGVMQAADVDDGEAHRATCGARRAAAMARELPARKSQSRVVKAAGWSETKSPRKPRASMAWWTPSARA